MSDNQVSEAMAKFFYEQVAGTSSGHMSNIANNPTLFGITAAHSSRVDSCYSMTRTEFAEFLKGVAEKLNTDDPQAF